MKILTVDDDDASRKVLTRALRLLGHDAVEACDGKQALMEYRMRHFNLVILDWLMPNLSGIELTKLIRKDERPKYTYVIMLTSREGKESYLEGMRAGADDFINKPFDKDTLAARLHVAERILNLQQEVKQLEGLLPICSYCKKIKDEEEAWQQMEAYISRRTEANFSHGVCPDCYEKHMLPQLVQLRKDKRIA